MKVLIAVLFLSVSVNSNMYCQTDSKTYETVLREMMEATGAEATFAAVIGQMIDMFKQQDTNGVPEKFWDEIGAEMNATAMKDLVGLLAPVYQKHMTTDDLKAITAFYESPVGKKYAEKTPAITQESMKVGQIWGEEIGMKIIKKLEEEGY